MSGRKKVEITVSLDEDVVDRLDTYAEIQRSSRSALVNRICAEKVGLVPEETMKEMEKQ